MGKPGMRGVDVDEEAHVEHDDGGANGKCDEYQRPKEGQEESALGAKESMYQNRIAVKGESNFLNLWDRPGKKDLYVSLKQPGR